MKDGFSSIAERVRGEEMRCLYSAGWMPCFPITDWDGARMTQGVGATWFEVPPPPVEFDLLTAWVCFKAPGDAGWSAPDGMGISP